jgi:hypothetical protein
MKVKKSWQSSLTRRGRVVFARPRRRLFDIFEGAQATARTADRYAEDFIDSARRKIGHYVFVGRAAIERYWGRVR